MEKENLHLDNYLSKLLLANDKGYFAWYPLRKEFQVSKQWFENNNLYVPKKNSIYYFLRIIHPVDRSRLINILRNYTKDSVNQKKLYLRFFDKNGLIINVMFLVNSSTTDDHDMFLGVLIKINLFNEIGNLEETTNEYNARTINKIKDGIVVELNYQNNRFNQIYIGNSFSSPRSN